MLNTPGDMGAKPLGKGRGQHGRQRWLAKIFANVFCQAVWPTCFPSTSRPFTVALHMWGGKDALQTVLQQARPRKPSNMNPPRRTDSLIRISDLQRSHVLNRSQPLHKHNTTQHPATTQTYAGSYSNAAQTHPNQRFPDKLKT